MQDALTPGKSIKADIPESGQVSILLVDDHEENLIALEAILARPEYHLVKCTSGEAALRELLLHEFALILLDVMMPEMDGFELAQLIRQRQRTRHTPLIFLTAIAKEVRHIYRGYSVGAVDYIQKPLEPELVIAKVNVFVDLFRKNKTIEMQAEQLRAKEKEEREIQLLRMKAQAEEKQSFLARASRKLSSSLDYALTQRNIAELSVPYLADWCVLDMKDSKGDWVRSEVLHRSYDKLELVERFKALPIESHKGSPGVALSLITGLPEVMSTVSPAQLRGVSTCDEQFALLQALETKSVISVPLEVRGQTLGVLTLISSETSRRYGTDDLKFACELARHVSLALDNARLYKIATDSNRLKDEFLATISHELRTPLCAVIGWSDLLADHKFDEEISSCVETIRRNARSLSDLVEDLLDMSRIISGKIRLDIQTFDLAPLIRAAVDSMLPAAQAKEIQLEWSYNNQSKMMVGDPAKVQQIAWNLVSNAIKFTPRGGTVHATLSHDDAQQSLVLSIRDNGIGLSPSFIPYIFERFIQADGKLTRKAGGLGLGLAIVRHLVELHGGTVIAESRGEGYGSTFTVRFPVNMKTSHLPLEIHPEKTISTHAQPFVSLQGKVVLVVDDQEDAQILVEKVLSRHGATVIRTSSVADAISMFESTNPDVILCDIGMPEKDGYSLLNYIRHEARHPIPIAAITAHVGENNKHHVLEAGFDDFIAKPLNFDVLVSSVAQLAYKSSQAGIESSKLN